VTSKSVDDAKNITQWGNQFMTEMCDCELRTQRGFKGLKHALGIGV
jgi:hypothetical protein